MNNTGIRYATTCPFGNPSITSQPSSIHDSHPRIGNTKKVGWLGNKMKLNPCPTLCSITNFIWTSDLNVKNVILKLLKITQGNFVKSKRNNKFNPITSEVAIEEEEEEETCNTLQQ